MKAGWEVKTLGEVLQKTETTNPNSRPEDNFEYIDVSSVSNLTFQIEETQNLKGKDAPSRARKLVKTNDILFATIRPTLQRIAIVPSNLNNQVCSTGYIVLRPNSLVHYKYLYYFLFTSDFMAQMELLQKGASYPAVTDNEVKSQNITFPSIQEQQRIVAILDQAFEGIAKARANAEQNLQNARALFESHLQSVFSQQGVGWIEARLGDICTIGDGNYSSKYPKASEFVTQGVPFLTATNLKNGTVVSDGIRFISKEQHSALTKGHVIKGDLVIVVRGSSTGNNSLLSEEYDGANLNSQLAFLRANEDRLIPEYLFAVFNSPAVMKSVKEAISGAAQPQLPNNRLLDIKVSYPNIKKQQNIVEELEKVTWQTKKLETLYQRKIDCLDELKKSLLQQAFAGEL